MTGIVWQGTRDAAPARAEQNRAYVRMLLWQRQPAFAAALAAAERDVSCSACPLSQLMRWRVASVRSEQSSF